MTDTHGSALSERVRRGDEHGVLLLLRSYKFDNEQLGEALLLAASRGDSRICRVLLQAGADASATGETTPPTLPPVSPNALPMINREAPTATRHQGRRRILEEQYASFGGTALHRAIEAQSQSCLYLFLSYGARPNVADSRGLTPLTLAALKPERLSLLHMLLQADDCQVDFKDPIKGRTAMHFAASVGNVDAMALLHQAGAAVNVRDLQGNTPLITAAHALRGVQAMASSGLEALLRAISFLVGKHANVRVVNRAGQSALLYTVDARHIEAMRLLLDHGAAVSPDLLRYACLELKHVAVTDCLLGAACQGEAAAARVGGRGGGGGDLHLASTLVGLLAEQPSKWMFANSQVELQVHQLARLLITHIRDVAVVDRAFRLQDDLAKCILLENVTGTMTEQAAAETLLPRLGLVGFALMNGKLGIARMLHRAGYQLINRTELLHLPWLHRLAASQTWLWRTLTSPAPLQVLARAQIRAHIEGYCLKDAVSKFKGLSPTLRAYLLLEDLTTMQAYDGIVREDCELLLDERYPNREQARALHHRRFWVY